MFRRPHHDYAYYKKHAQDVKLEDITSSAQNKDIIQKLRDGDPDFTSLHILDSDSNDDEEEYVVSEGDEPGWLGYFIGESKTLISLRLSYLYIPIDLIQGICWNRSIQSFDIKQNETADTLFFHFAPFFERNQSLTYFTFGCSSIGSDQSARNFSMALVKCKFLKHLCFEGGIDGNLFRQSSDETFIDLIATALNFLPQLEELTFEEYWIEERGYTALSYAFMMGGMGKLRTLKLIGANVDDNALQTLVAGMKHCRNLVELNLCGNNQITEAGLRTLSSFLQSESCRLEDLNLGSLLMGDEGARVFAAGLTTSKSLKRLHLPFNAISNDGIIAVVSAAVSENLESLNLIGNSFAIAGVRSLSNLIESERSCLKHLHLGTINFAKEGNEEGAAAILANALSNNTSLMHLDLIITNIQNVDVEHFSKLLCDTSSINNIYSSNHTIESIGNLVYVQDSKQEEIARYLDWNRYTKYLGPKHRQLVPMCKILTHYPDLADMKPFYKWKLTFLPLVADWFHRARAIRHWLKEFEIFQRRKLSAMYKFIRGVPLMVADGYWSQQLKQIQVKKRNFDETEKQLLEILAKKRKLEEEEMQLLHRLGGKRGSD